MKKLVRAFLWLVGLLVLFLFLNNTNLFYEDTIGVPSLLAHRGVAQRLDMDGVENDTCTAKKLIPGGHELLENTIPSMEASIQNGADIIELDIHPTTDGEFAVFHDWTLDCRTEGSGRTRDHTMADLKKLDVGYGYTADDGQSYPLRGKGIGLMPSLMEVLLKFPNQRFMINMKSNDPEEGAFLARVLNKLSSTQKNKIWVYGSAINVESFKFESPDFKVFSKEQSKSCLVAYFLFGGFGVMPKSCHNTIVPVPINIAPWLWGWPNRFYNRAQEVGSEVMILGPYKGGGFSSGIDSKEDLAKIPKSFRGVIWTNEIKEIAKLLKF